MRFVPNQNERRQSPCTCPYDSDNPDYAASKQDDYLKNDVHEATSAHRPSILRKILGYALTKSGKNDRIIKILTLISILNWLQKVNATDFGCYFYE